MYHIQEHLNNMETEIKLCKNLLDKTIKEESRRKRRRDKRESGSLVV